MGGDMRVFTRHLFFFKKTLNFHRKSLIRVAYKGHSGHYGIHLNQSFMKTEPISKLIVGVDGPILYQ